MKYIALTLAASLALVVPARAKAPDADDVTGSVTTVAPRPAPASLHRLGAGPRQLLFSGETDARDFLVFLTAAQARSHAHLHLAVTTAVSVMEEASRLRVLINDVPVSETALSSPIPENPKVLDIELPPSLLEPGANSVRIDVAERHRVDCSLAATYELWTRIDPATAGLTFDGLPAWAPTALDDLPALPPAEDGTVHLRLVVPPGLDAAALGRLLRAAQGVALRGRFARPSFEVVPAPAERPGLDIVAGTADDLRRWGLGDLLDANGASTVLRPGHLPGQATLVIAAESPTEVASAAAALAPPPGTEPVGTPAGQRAASLLGGHPVEGGSISTLRDLGLRSQEFSGRLFRVGFDLSLPPDAFVADYDRMTIRLDAAYTAGLDRGAQVLLRVNGRDAATLPLADPGGEAFQGRPMTVPLSALRPGLNRITLEAELPIATDRACDAATTVTEAGGAGHKRFALLDTGTVELPALARIARLPSLSAAAASGFPYAGRAAPGRLYLPRPDADAIAAAATFLARAAIAGGELVDVDLRVGREAQLDGPVLMIGAFSDLPPAMIDAVGLDSAAMRDAWTHVEARSAAAARLGEGSPRPRRSDAVLFRRWSDDAAAARWRFEPGALAARLLRKVAGLGPEDILAWHRAEERVAVTPDVRLAVAQHEAPNGQGDTWMAILAPSGAALRAGIADLTAPDLWGGLDGRAALLDAGEARLITTRARVSYFIPTAPLSLGNIRLIAAGWLSTRIDVYVLGFLLIAVALGIATSAVLRRSGERP